ncbi:hypothetical protein D3Z36_03190 [Lachnospiraceae bacterium]|nr:hypothetical protein [Lachnospiraceae bacterium]
MRFKGKISKWFYGVMIFVAVILIPIIVLAIINAEAFVFAFSLAVLAFLEIFCTSIVVRNFAELKSESLLIVFGFIRLRILYNDIKEIRTTNDPSSSLAASYDRIKIQYGNGKTVMIALHNREEFYKEIQKKTSDIRII